MSAPMTPYLHFIHCPGWVRISVCLWGKRKKDDVGDTVFLHPLRLTTRVEDPTSSIMARRRTVCSGRGPWDSRHP